VRISELILGRCGNRGKNTFIHEIREEEGGHANQCARAVTWLILLIELFGELLGPSFTLVEACLQRDRGPKRVSRNKSLDSNAIIPKR
jgi:hypothetical protein